MRKGYLLKTYSLVLEDQVLLHYVQHRGKDVPLV